LIIIIFKLLPETSLQGDIENLLKFNQTLCCMIMVDNIRLQLNIVRARSGCGGILSNQSAAHAQKEMESLK